MRAFHDTIFSEFFNMPVNISPRDAFDFLSIGISYILFSAGFAAFIQMRRRNEREIEFPPLVYTMHVKLN